ncbi:LysR family transcriptional regulator [Caballeronia udeis]|uniref:LysR family transcriptional regulator n=1 Tax=Caballeronia udeis TaxID=1232866 RepID=UPI0038505775
MASTSPIETMPTPLPPLNALKAFESAARHLSFTKAAAEMHVTPAAVGFQVNALEAHLGVSLFERTKGGLVLTQAGRACLPKLRESFRIMRESIELLGRFKDKEPLTIDCPPSFANRWLMPRLHRFLVQHADIDVRIVSRMHGFGLAWTQQAMEANNIRQWMAEVDVLLLLGDGRYENLDVTHILPLTLTPLLSPSLASRIDLNQPGQLVSLPLLYDDRGVVRGGESYWKMWAQFARITAPDESHGHHFAHAMTALEAAADDMGVVVSAPALALSELESGRLVAPFPVLSDCGVAYHAVSATPRRSIDLFVQWIVDEARSTNHALSLLTRTST